MSKVAFNKSLNIPKDVAEWEKQNQMEMLQEKLDIITIPWHDYEKVAQMFDVVDVIFDLPGYIAGYRVSPDSRYLHVNIRPWPPSALFSTPLDPPPNHFQSSQNVLLGALHGVSCPPPRTLFVAL